MSSVSTIFWLLFLCNCSLEDFHLRTPLEFGSCKHYVTPPQRNYEDFFEILASDRNGTTLDFHFFVKCEKDVRILFACCAPVREGDHVYEIVIDAGNHQNRSDIRRDSKSFRKTSRYANRKLSATEFRAFSVQLDQSGNIAVRDEEGDDINSWRDPYPLDVKMFSFKSGSEAKAEWYFHCVKRNVTHTARERCNLPKINFAWRSYIPHWSVLSVLFSLQYFIFK